ncbi:MAG: hypothetical protein IPJ88_13690 [Myxococcales bacterium]|nr:MAG: hypothetical protein IPJ88_13690 [Myxococcales bacterium]
MMPIRQPHRWLLVALLGLLLAAKTTEVKAEDLDAVQRELIDIEGRARTISQGVNRAKPPQGPTYVEERLADGELFYRLKDYSRSSIIFADIVDHYPNHAAYPDALMLLGESLYMSGDLYGARAQFRALLDRGQEPAFRSYTQRALSRLIEVALRTRDFSGVEPYLERLQQIPSASLQAATAYAKAKYFYHRAINRDLSSSAEDFDREVLLENKDELAIAEQAFSAVKSDSEYWLAASYFLGVIHTPAR